MTTLANRPGTALVVVDVQNGVMTRTHDRDAVIARIAALAERARGAGTPVVWVQQTDDNLKRGTEPWALVPELEGLRQDGEPVVLKLYGDSFEDTDLEQVLAGLGAGRLVVAGAQSDACIRCTLHGALARGYDVTLAADAHTCEDNSAYGPVPTPAEVIAHTNLYWHYTEAPGRSCAAVPAAEVTFGA
ncbi:cysteine hydrolase [Mangrovactinospora gilvigrisea]|uniref:Cysteine hydrolase n=1 Tax=Mangrovactinospora gilvigrisea TaxID=1428644 RepID=A0A1J7BDL6_9ACTN|nr:isochorismatase family protein [Mangrovactinospora gilvigrisea]OIV36742.1 cysteine hydrolase [Mangrovactinospora gilvigrisea]